MKSWVSGGMLAATIALPALSGAAWADDFHCSNATLKGEYAFGVTNYNAPQIHVAAGIVYFDGKTDQNGQGHLTQQDYRGNTTPIGLSMPGDEVGTYQVNPDCSGIEESQVANGSIVALFVISDGGRHIHIVVGSLTAAGSNVPVQTSADAWKVAPSDAEDSK